MKFEINETTIADMICSKRTMDAHISFLNEYLRDERWKYNDELKELGESLNDDAKEAILAIAEGI